MQIVACVSCDVSLISSYHLPSLLFNLVPIDLLYFPTITWKCAFLEVTTGFMSPGQCHVTLLWFVTCNCINVVSNNDHDDDHPQQPPSTLCHWFRPPIKIDTKYRLWSSPLFCSPYIQDFWWPPESNVWTASHNQWKSLINVDLTIYSFLSPSFLCNPLPTHLSTYIPILY